MKMLYIFFIYILFGGLALANLATPNNNIKYTDHTNNEEGDLDLEKDFLHKHLTKTDDQSSSAVGRFLFKKKRARRLTCNEFEVP